MSTTAHKYCAKAAAESCFTAVCLQAFPIYTQFSTSETDDIIISLKKWFTTTYILYTMQQWEVVILLPAVMMVSRWPL